MFRISASSLEHTVTVGDGFPMQKLLSLRCSCSKNAPGVMQGLTRYCTCVLVKNLKTLTREISREYEIVLRDAISLQKSRISPAGCLPVSIHV